MPGRAARGDRVGLFLVEQLHLEGREQRLDFRPRVEGYRAVAHPSVAIAEQLAGQTPAPASTTLRAAATWRQSPPAAQAATRNRKLTSEHAPHRVSSKRATRVSSLARPGRPPRPGRAAAGAQPVDGRRLRVDRQHPPAAREHRHRVAPVAAAEVHRPLRRRPFGVEAVEGEDEGAPRRPRAGGFVIAPPRRAPAAASSPAPRAGAAAARLVV